MDIFRVKNVDGNFCTVFASSHCICKLISKIQLVRKINSLGAQITHLIMQVLFILKRL